MVEPSLNPRDKAQESKSTEELTDWILTHHRPMVLGGLSKAFRGMSLRPNPEEFINHVLERCLYKESLRSKLILGIEQEKNLAVTIWCTARNVGREERRKLERHATRTSRFVETLDDLTRISLQSWRTTDAPNTHERKVTRFLQEFAKLDRVTRRILRERLCEKRSFASISKRISSARQRSSCGDSNAHITESEVERLFEDGKQELRDRMEDSQP